MTEIRNMQILLEGDRNRYIAVAYVPPKKKAWSEK